MSEQPEQKDVTETAVDDIVLRFRTVRSNVMGRVVRLGPALDAILSRHDYPPHVAEALGQALGLVAMLGATLKGENAVLTLQAKSDGPVSLLVADYDVSGALRGYATFQNGDAPGAGKKIFGAGSLAMTIDPGEGFDRYQGIVELNGNSLVEAAHTYFAQSEQLPTFVRLAVAQSYDALNTTGDKTWTWRAGGLMIQHLAREGGAAEVGAPQDQDEDQEPVAVGEDNEDWQRARFLAETVEDHELLDPNLSAERLLYRLFHEEGVVVFPTEKCRDQCRCSRDRVRNLLKTIAGGDMQDMTDESGQISVTCEFCSTKYAFNPDDLDQQPE